MLILLHTLQAPVGARAAGSPVSGLRKPHTQACFVSSPLRCSGSARPLALISPLHASGGPVASLWGALRGTGARMMRFASSTGAKTVMLLRTPASSLFATRPASSGPPTSAMRASNGDDMWLEKVDSDEALQWVRTQNSNTFESLGDPADSPLFVTQTHSRTSMHTQAQKHACARTLACTRANTHKLTRIRTCARARARALSLSRTLTFTLTFSIFLSLSLFTHIPRAHTHTHKHILAHIHAHARTHKHTHFTHRSPSHSLWLTLMRRQRNATH